METPKKISSQALQKLKREENLKSQALQGLQYLLKKSMKYSKFFQDKLEDRKQETENNNGEGVVGFGMPKSFIRQRIKENHREKLSAESLSVLEKLKYFEGGVLKPYQEEGLIWLMILYENGINGILADEMGLGKTIQVIALICHLYEMEIPGPFLIVVPLSTVPNWLSEFKKFAPKIPIVSLVGSMEARNYAKLAISQGNYAIHNKKVKPVILASYQTPMCEPQILNSFQYQYIVVDEGHRLKNPMSKLGRELSSLKTKNRLLLTGTPLQNNLTELWSLLHFLLPDIFINVDVFSYLLQLEEMKDNAIGEESTNIISTMHKVLQPFMLRRLKSDVLIDMVPKKNIEVYCPMTKLQMDLYRFILERNINGLKKEEEDEEDISTTEHFRKRKRYSIYGKLDENCIEDCKIENETSIKKKTNIKNYICRITMANTVMMFRKAVNHPHLIHFPLKPDSDKRELLIDEKLITDSGKMLVLDAMLSKLKQKNHKVLIFCTLVMMLDLVEEFVIMRGYKYSRLDGSYNLENREKTIREFNTNPKIFLFLISTRAGGLGLNLSSADTVIFIDRDWNPQVDIQAQDRCHRIGQTKPVMVYSLVTKNTVDEAIISRGIMKRRLEKVIIKDGLFKSLRDKSYEKNIDYEELKQLLESSDCSTKIHSNGYVFTDKELNDILDRSDLYEEMKKS